MFSRSNSHISSLIWFISNQNSKFKKLFLSFNQHQKKNVPPFIDQSYNIMMLYRAQNKNENKYCNCNLIKRSFIVLYTSCRVACQGSCSSELSGLQSEYKYNIFYLQAFIGDCFLRKTTSHFEVWMTWVVYTINHQFC